MRRGRRAVLDGVDFEVPRGKITGLLGPSGSGKSTLMRAIVGANANVTGELRVLGRAAGSPELRHRVGYATQAASVYDDLSATQNLVYFASAVGAGRDDVDRVISVTRLEAQAHQRVATMSGGERGRVSLAAALLGSPELIVLDEPTVGLDPVLRVELWGVFRALAAEGVALLVSSHVMDEAQRCDRLLLMREGRIIANTTPEGLLATTGADNAESAFLALIEAQS